jgi:WD40 repeat protein
VWGVALAPDGKRALSGGADRTMRLWDVETGKEEHKFERHTDWVWGVAFTPDGKRVLSGSADSTMRLWSMPPR